MNFVIIEDDPDDLTAAITNFSEAFILDEEKDDKVRLNKKRKITDDFKYESITPESVASFFHENFIYDLKWIKSFNEAFREIKSGVAIEEWDVVIIDLNLEKDFDYTSCPETVKPADAGFYIYCQLIFCGFPQDRIAFLTANSDEVNKLTDVTERLGFNITNINKTEREDYLEQWLLKHRCNKRLLLRRAIAEGCKRMKEILAQEKLNALRINDFISCQENKLTINDAETWLEATPRLCSIDGHLDLALVLVMLYHWDGKPEGDCSASIKDTHTLIAYILRNARNWCSHGYLVPPFSEVDLGYLFIIIFRAFIKIPPILQRYEYKIIELFPESVVINEIDPVDFGMRIKKEYDDLVSNTKSIIHYSEHAHTLPKAIESYRDEFIKNKHGRYNKIANLCVNLGGYNDKFDLLKKMLLVDKANDARRGDWKTSDVRDSTEINDWLATIYPRIAKMVGII